MSAPLVLDAQGRLNGLVNVLWAGNINGNANGTSVLYDGGGNDKNPLLISVLNAPDNSKANYNHSYSAYHKADLNMNGNVEYAGPSNDANVILRSIFLHPQNPDGNYGFEIYEQLP
jgi:hypothetical protein